MSHIYPLVWFFLAIVIGCEYSLKQIFENIAGNLPVKPGRIYTIYRIFHFIILFLLLNLFFSPALPWYVCLLMTTMAIMFGMLEFLSCYFLKIIYKYFRMESHLIYFFPLILIIVIITVFIPSFHLQTSPFVHYTCTFISKYIIGKPCSETYLLMLCSLLILLAHPANYLIRWLMGKKEDKSLPEIVLNFSPSITHAKNDLSIAEIAISLAEEKEELETKETLKAGRIIGMLERWLMIVFIIIGQFSSIGFVLTAKSIARFKKFEETRFAEYYLMGTLYSTIIAITLGLLFLYMKVTP